MGVEERDEQQAATPGAKGWGWLKHVSFVIILFRSTYNTALPSKSDRHVDNHSILKHGHAIGAEEQESSDMLIDKRCSFPAGRCAV